MMLLNDKQISKLGIFEPYTPYKVKVNGLGEPAISYGQSSAGYDLRLGNKFLFVKDEINDIDPKNTEDVYYEVRFDSAFYLMPNEVVLAQSYEYIHIPKNVMAIAMDKSTYARAGIATNVTPLEPDWRGYLTIEIRNNQSVPVRIYPNEGIIQILLFEIEEPNEVYGNGKYQNQEGVTPSKV